MSLPMSDAWANWHPTHATVCDICRLPVAPITGGWAVVHDSPEVNHDWSKGAGHVHTVNGQER